MKLPQTVGVALTALIVASGCSPGLGGSAEPRLTTPGEVSPFEIAMPNREARIPFVLRNELRVCLDREGSVDIVDVRFKEAFGGIQVDDFAVAPLDPYPGLEESDGFPLEDHGYNLGNVTVDVACPEDKYDRTDESISVPHMVLGVELSKPSDGSAGGRELVVSYETSGGDRDSLSFPLVLTLCEGDNTDADCVFTK